MMTKVYFFIGLFVLTQPAFAGSSVQLLTEEFPPYQFYEDQNNEKSITGISMEIVKALQTKVGHEGHIKVLPWSRGLKLLAKNTNTALFSTARTPAREDKYKWVGPLAALEMGFFKKKGSPITITSLEEAKKVQRIGVAKNVATHEILTNMGFTNLDVMKSGSDDKNLKRLEKGRIDLWPTSYYAGIYSAKKLAILDRIEFVPDVSILSGHLYMAFNKKTDDKIIDQWQSALDQLKRDGLIDGIVKKYDR